MLQLVLINETSREVIYNYLPEQGEVYGTITLNKVTGDVISVKKASNDRFGTYFGHALSRIKKYVTNSCYLERDVVAWY